MDGDIPIAPHDLTRDRRPEYIVVRPGENGQVAYIRDGRIPNKLTTISLGAKGTIPMVGKFLEYLNFAWIDRATSSVVVRKKDGSQLSFSTVLTGSVAVVRPDGTVVTPTADGTFGGDGGSNIGNSGICQRTGGPTDFNDGTGGLLWKVPSARPGRPVMLFPSDVSQAVYYTAKISLWGSDGSDLTGGNIRADSLPSANGGRAHFWLQTPTSVFVKKAPITVKVVFPGNKTWCLEVKNPGVRND